MIFAQRFKYYGYCFLTKRNKIRWLINIKFRKFELILSLRKKNDGLKRIVMAKNKPLI